MSEEKLETRKLARRFCNSQGIRKAVVMEKGEGIHMCKLMGSVTNYMWRYRGKETSQVLGHLKGRNMVNVEEAI